jgi:hypothetical protein
MIPIKRGSYPPLLHPSGITGSFQGRILFLLASREQLQTTRLLLYSTVLHWRQQSIPRARVDRGVGKTSFWMPTARPTGRSAMISWREQQDTGFWDNILARGIDGRVQIAYGHHRWKALKRVMNLTDMVDIPVKDLDDATMLKIMANENMESWALGPKVIDETIKVTKKFLDEHPEEVAKVILTGVTGKPLGNVPIAPR